MSNSNANRALDQLVSADGWIGEFDEDGRAAVHVDAVFREGHFGADPANIVRFRVSLTRAEVVVCIPGGEPLKVVRSSVRRTPASADRQRTITHEATLEGEAQAKLGLTNTLTPDLSANIGGKTSARRTTREEQVETITDYLEQHFNTLDGHPAWEVQRSDGSPLSGAPWNANDAPRLSVRRTGDMDQPFLRVEIRCRRQDLRIEGLELKDPEAQKRFWQRDDPDKNRAAAEQVIKEELCKAGFFSLGDVGEDHAEMLIADVVILED